MSPTNDASAAEDVTKYLVSVNAGDFVFRENDPGADMYIIRSGQVELLKHYAGQERQIAMLEAGDFFGEMSLLEEQPRELSARAVGPVDLVRIDASTFDRIVQEAPEIPVRMLRKLCRRLRNYQEHDARAAAIAMGPLAPRAAPAPAPAPESAGGDQKPAAAARGKAVLVDAVSQKEFDLGGRPESTVGRMDRSTGFAADVDLTALDTQRTLSRRHAKIVARGGEYFVREEIGTRNGTFVNGERLQTGVEVKLASGDRLRFGLIETVFEIR